MRDANRIKEFCDRLKAAWSTVPDWRFGQLVYNALRPTMSDGFNVEDEDMLWLIERCVGIDMRSVSSTDDGRIGG